MIAANMGKKKKQVDVFFFYLDLSIFFSPTMWKDFSLSAVNEKYF